MWFRNLQLFRLHDGWPATPDEFVESLAGQGFRSCGGLERQTQGWVPPRGDESEILFANGRQMLFALGVEQKILPVSVVRQYAQTRMRVVEAEQGFKPGRSQSREIFDTVEAELLPRALVKRRLTYVWADPVAGWLVVNAAGSARADEVIEQLKLTLGNLPLSLLKTVQSPGTAMTQWLSLGEAPGRFSIDQDCELHAAGGAGGSVRYSRLPLDADEVRAHIAQGRLAGRLALTWNDRIAFVLTEQLQIKRVAFLDVLKEAAEQNGTDGDAFAADFTIMTGELALMLADLVEALGGEAR